MKMSKRYCSWNIYEFTTSTKICSGHYFGITILVPHVQVKSLQLTQIIWRLGTRRWDLRKTKLLMICSDFTRMAWYQGLYSLSGKTSYRKISRSLEAAGFGFKLFQSLWNLAGTSAELLPRCLSNFRAIRPLQHPISRLRDFTRFGGKASYRWVNRSPG